MKMALMDMDYGHVGFFFTFCYEIHVFFLFTKTGLKITS